MGVDFGALVLGPTMDVFAVPIVFTPVVSQRFAATAVNITPVLARGVFAMKQVTTQTTEGVFTDQQPTLGIRLAEFAAPPEQGDTFVLNHVTWTVWDCLPDGQGGADLVLKRVVVGQGGTAVSSEEEVWTSGRRGLIAEAG